MNRVTKMIKKVAMRATKLALIGALVGGISMESYASATLEKAGPVREKVEAAKLQTVQQSLEEVVAAITKADPEWVKGLPVVKGKAEEQLYWYEVQNGNTVGEYQFHLTRTDAIGEEFCDPGDDEICLFGSEDPDLDNNTPINSSNPDQLIMKRN